MRIDVLTLFPAMFQSPFEESIVRRAIDRSLLELNCHNIRDFALGRHLQVDDTPYGGGQGMVMQVDVIARCLRSIPRLESCRVIYMSPRGEVLRQPKVLELGAFKQLVLLCGHYEGVDERSLDMVDEELSIGDYVLSGGEIPAMVLIDAVAREIPGVLGNAGSVLEESFRDRELLEYPHYTRPAEFEGQKVPEVLLSGHHERIRRWRKKESLRMTLLKRPDLMVGGSFDSEDRELLMEILFGEEK